VRIKRGDKLPALVVDCTNDGVPVNLTSATGVRVIAKRGLTVVFIDTAPVRDNVNGIVTHAWAGTETDLPGRLMCEVEVTWPTAKPQTFPAFGALPVDIEDDLA
jgi:hypothetical protein